LDTENNPLSYHILIKFFLPLAVFPILVALSHTIINSALARMPLPELSIAIFTVVKSVTNIINAPSIMTRQLFTSVIEDKKSYYLSRNFAFVLMFILFGLIMTLGITSLGDFVFKHIIGLQSQKEVDLATSAMMVTAFLPIVVVLRNAYQGIATGLKKTLLIVPGVILRVIGMVIFLGWVVKTNSINGVIAGCLAYVLGIALEGVFILGGLKYNSGSIIKAAEKMPSSDFNKVHLDYYKIFKFFLPLAFTIIITMFIQPVIQSGLARSSSPVRSLAAYGVSWTLVTMLAGPLRMLHQISLVYHNSDQNMRKIKIFNLSLGVLTSAIIVLFALSPVGYYVLHNLIAVSHEITILAQKVILAFAVFPLARAFRETYWGMMMKKRSTPVIAKAKGLNLFAVILSLVILLGFINFYFNIEPAVLGAIVFTIGEFLETFIIKRNSKNVKKAL
jgi:hypothetical protein